MCNLNIDGYLHKCRAWIRLDDDTKTWVTELAHMRAIQGRDMSQKDVDICVLITVQPACLQTRIYLRRYGHAVR